ncbi:MAG TPA: GNAT family N-acetyltransferase [Deferrisomatales bacterium]|nr:GNAT family N-acetyltransferase [Deferrisomatales bacterium]
MATRLRGLAPGDLEPLLAVLEADRVFRPGELEVAREVLEAAIAKGEGSGYHCAVAEQDADPVGFACWGPTPCTEGTFDLYWLAVHPRGQRTGVASALLAAAIDGVVRVGGRLLVVETSGSAPYAPAQAFYAARGFHVAARIPDFYRPDDPKVVYTKALHP